MGVKQARRDRDIRVRRSHGRAQAAPPPSTEGRGTRLARPTGMRSVVALLLLVTSVARADMSPPEGRFSVGVLVERLAVGDEAATAAGPAVGFAALAGPEVAPGVTLGLGVDASLFRLSRDVDMSSGVVGFELAVGCAAALRGPEVVWRAQVGVGLLGFADGVATGPVARVSVAWPVARTLELAIELRAGYLFFDEYSMVPVGVLAGLRF
jgi:hypothetical protein